ncbi:hypothetical protein MHYP_G00263910 [Metynnis hypsauchen]
MTPSYLPSHMLQGGGPSASGAASLMGVLHLSIHSGAAHVKYTLALHCWRGSALSGRREEQQLSTTEWSGGGRGHPATLHVDPLTHSHQPSTQQSEQHKPGNRLKAPEPSSAVQWRPFTESSIITARLNRHLSLNSALSSILPLLADGDGVGHLLSSMSGLKFFKATWVEGHSNSSLQNLAPAGEANEAQSSCLLDVLFHDSFLRPQKGKGRSTKGVLPGEISNAQSYDLCRGNIWALPFFNTSDKLWYSGGTLIMSGRVEKALARVGTGISTAQRNCASPLKGVLQK